MMANRETLQRVCASLFGFALTVACAHYQKWSTSDLVWGFWGCSLIVGYVWTMAIVAATVIRARKLKDASYPASATWAIAGFLTFVFVFAHWVYASFLGAFLPPHEAWPLGLFGFARRIWSVVSTQRGLLISVFVSRFADFPVGGLLERAGEKPEDGPAQKVADSLLGDLPRNMLQMHGTIFALLAFNIVQVILGDRFHFLRESEMPVLYVLLLLYFFPWELLRRTNPAVRQSGGGSEQ